MSSKEEGAEALKIARESIEKYLRSGKKLEIKGEKFEERRGVFVTLNKRGELRGCIGFPYPTQKLKDALVDAAISAATSDPRFSRVTLDEMSEITVEVTILTEPERIRLRPVDLPKRIEIGRHGLIVKKGHQQGLLLPQVPVEHGMDEEEFLSHTCMKAGLFPDAWLDEDTELYRFEGQIFSEENRNE